MGIIMAIAPAPSANVVVAVVSVVAAAAAVVVVVVRLSVGQDLCKQPDTSHDHEVACCPHGATCCAACMVVGVKTHQRCAIA